MEIAENVYQLDCSKRSHVFLIKSDVNILIDTGMPGLAGQILSELGSLGVAAGSIQKILLTHHDVDHIGNAKRLQEATGAELWASKEDMPYITGAKNRPGLKHVIQTIVRPQKPIVSGCYTANQHFGEIGVISAPGHTPGHSIFQYRKVLFIGDLFKVLDGRFRLLPEFMNWNQEEVKKSISLLKDLDYEWICPSHGQPISSGNIVDEFLKQF